MLLPGFGYYQRGKIRVKKFKKRGKNDFSEVFYNLGLMSKGKREN